MNLKKMLAVILSVAAVMTASVAAFADSGNINSEAKATWSERLRDPFKKFLDDGVISDATYEKMKAYIEQNKPQRAEQTERSGILDELLKAGVITQAEYDAIKEAVSAREKINIQRPALGEKSGRQGKPQMVDSFDKFVEDGVISEKTAAAIREYIKANRPVKSEIREKMKNHADIFSMMLDEGVITQAEYNAIKASMPERPILNKWRGKNADK